MSLESLKEQILLAHNYEDRELIKKMLKWKFMGNHYDHEEAKEYREYLVNPDKFEGDGFWKWEGKKCIPLTPENFGLVEGEDYVDITYEDPKPHIHNLRKLISLVCIVLRAFFV